MNLTIGDISLKLLPSKAVLLADGTLVVADIHLGRGASFQAQGLTLPHGDSAADLERLRQLCLSQNASRLIINGDFFHAPAGLTTEREQEVADWLARMEIPVELVLGNHEVKLPRLPCTLTPIPSIECDGLLIIHDPLQAPADRPSLTAHWHPVAKIVDGKRTTLRMPCFLARGNTLVLPAFGTFTGGATIAPMPGDRLFIGSGERVIEVPSTLLAPTAKNEPKR